MDDFALRAMHGRVTAGFDALAGLAMPRRTREVPRRPGRDMLQRDFAQQTGSPRRDAADGSWRRGQRDLKHAGELTEPRSTERQIATSWEKQLDRADDPPLPEPPPRTASSSACQATLLQAFGGFYRALSVHAQAWNIISPPSRTYTVYKVLRRRRDISSFSLLSSVSTKIWA